LEELKALEDDRKILLPENTPKSPSKEPEVRAPSTDEDGDVTMNGTEMDIDDASDDEAARARRRGGDRANERKRKRVEEKAKAEAAAKIPKTTKQFQKVIKSIDLVKAKIAKEEEAIVTIDEDLRQADCARFKLMGYDRYWNKYWWFERNGMPFGGLPDSSTAQSGYANAMVWIQGPSEDERRGFLEEEAGTKWAADQDGDVDMNGHSDRLTVLQRQAREENGTTLTSPTQYGFISSPEDFESLLSFFDVRGVREKKLKATFETFKEHILSGMRNREKYLATSVAAAADNDDGKNGGRSTRNKQFFDPGVWRCLQWRNESAIEEMDHTHYNHPQPKKTKKKQQEGKNVPLNRQGKPISRQGERYNF
jgi:hypothetical protein